MVQWSKPVHGGNSLRFLQTPLVGPRSVSGSKDKLSINFTGLVLGN